jgi:hypothetical protein
MLNLNLQGHSEKISFLVTPALSFPIILGYAWLQQHNPLIDWATRNVSFPQKPNIASIISTSPNLQVYPFMEPLGHPPPLDPPPFLAEYQDVFSAELANKLPPHRSFDFPIHLLPNSTPPFSKVYSLTVDERNAMKQWIKENLEKGFIRPSKSPFGAPCFFVKKKNGELRLCVDYRRLNAITVKNRNPLPLIVDLIRSLSKGKIFSVLDLRGAYNLIRIEKGHEFRTAFVTVEGQFESLVMGFGPTNCPAHFQSIMNNLFKNMIGTSVEIYLDDIVIYSQNLDDHWQQLKAALKILRENQLYCKMEKCLFGSSSISYLVILFQVMGSQWIQKRLLQFGIGPLQLHRNYCKSIWGFATFTGALFQPFLI